MVLSTGRLVCPSLTAVLERAVLQMSNREGGAETSRPARHAAVPIPYSVARSLLDFAERWITLNVPPTAQCSERAYGSASRVRTRAFDFVTGHKQLPIRVQNIR